MGHGKPPEPKDPESTAPDSRSRSAPGVTPASAQGSPADRRSQRVHIHIPVLVYGNWKGEPFREETQTEVVNAHGARIVLATPVEKGQRLYLTHAGRHEELICRVVYIGAVEEGKTRIGIEFEQPAPRFWQIAFPPEDWDPSERKLPQAHPQAHPRKPHR